MPLAETQLELEALHAQTHWQAQARTSTNTDSGVTVLSRHSHADGTGLTRTRSHTGSDSESQAPNHGGVGQNLKPASEPEAGSNLNLNAVGEDSESNPQE